MVTAGFLLGYLSGPLLYAELINSVAQLPGGFSATGHQIITKLQCNLQNGKSSFKSIAIWQVNMETF